MAKIESERNNEQSGVIWKGMVADGLELYPVLDRNEGEGRPVWGGAEL